MDRPTDTATDTASSESALLDFCRKVECDIVVFGQATSPLVEAKFINRGIEMTSQGYDSIASVVRQRRFVWGIDMGGNGVAKNYDPLNRPRRQDFDGYLVENGAFYISRRIDILNTNCRISGKIGLVEMPEETYFEIDEPSDWCIAEELLRLRLRKNKTWSKIKTLVLDIDGVFTDAGMYYNDSGEAMKKFNTKDGMALQIARENGIEIAIITGEKHNINTRRMEKLKVNQLFQGVTDKYHVLKKIARNKETSLCNIAYVGDDINDVTCLLGAGLSFAPADSEEKAKANADIVLNRRGGYGAVREAVEKIIKYNNRNRED
jgi:N-acylneuraminate cytidylyltransferase